MKIDPTKIEKLIDHTLLKPEATPDQIDSLCAEAMQYGFFAVCVQPINVQRAVKKLEQLKQNSSIAHQPVVVSVAGFPFGAEKTETKTDQATRAMDDGAMEIDMVIQLGALIAGDHQAVRKDIESVAHAVHRHPGSVLKVILETGALTDPQIVSACRCCAEAEADFVKTSTGYHASGGATIEHVRLLYRRASPMRVKASGGIRTARQTLNLIEAGAARIGTSSGVAIVQSLRSASCCEKNEKSLQ